MQDDDTLDLLVVGAGPTGIAIGAAALRAGLKVLLVDRGALCGAMIDFPTNMTFFTTRDKLEIADVPFGIPDEKPNRRQALAYYQGVARRYQLPLALYEEVLAARREGGSEAPTTEPFTIRSRRGGEVRERRARAVALATGYWGQPKKLGVPGEELPWVHGRYLEPYAHYGQHVAVVGGGNSGCETALDLWRNNVRVTLLVRGPELKPTVKYWVRPDVLNRIEEGSIDGRFDTVVRELRGGAAAAGEEGAGEEGAGPGGVGGEVVIESGGRREALAVDAAYVLIGYLPDVALERRCGVEIDEATLEPVFDPETCESNVPGLYVAGTLQSGRDTGRIFIENSRDNGERIVGHLLRQGRAPVRGAAG